MDAGERIAEEISREIIKLTMRKSVDGTTKIAGGAVNTVTNASKALIVKAFNLDIISGKKDFESMMKSGTPLGNIELKQDVFKDVQNQAKKLNIPVSQVKMDKDTSKLIYRKFDENEIIKMLEKSIENKLDKDESKNEKSKDEKPKDEKSKDEKSKEKTDGVQERMDRAKEKVKITNDNKTQVKNHDKGTR